MMQFSPSTAESWFSLEM